MSVPARFACPLVRLRQHRYTADRFRDTRSTDASAMSRPAFHLRPGMRGILAGLACALAAWYLARLDLFVGLEDWLHDGAFLARGTRTSRAKVVIIGIDSLSLRKLKKGTYYISPELAQVVRYTHAQGAAAIGVDLLIPDDLSDRADLATPGSEGDVRPMGAAVRDAGNVVLPRWKISDAVDGEDGSDGWLLPVFQWRLKALDPELQADTDLGVVNLFEDGDQFVRRVQPLVREESAEGDTALVHFSLALHLVKHRKPLFDERGVSILEREGIPVDERGLMRINYVGPPGTFPELPFWKVLDAARKGLPLPELNGAVVLIGVTAREFQDVHATPFGNLYGHWLPGGKTAPRMPGTEIQAHAFATIEDRAFIRTLPWWSSFSVVMAFGVILGYTLFRAGVVGGLGIAAVHHFAWKGLALVLFVLFSFRLPLVAMLLLGTILYAAMFALRWQQTRAMMRAFMATAIADWFENDPSRLQRKIEEREVTVLFADIRAFSVFSDGRNPREVARLLMEYFDVALPLFEKHGGALNQYMGDGMMVLFGATDDQADHAARAVRAGVDLIRAIRGHAKKWAELGMPGLRIGVGINTGQTVVGAISAQNLMDFTAIGDTTNAAARIESLNKEQGTEFLISDKTFEQVSREELARLGCESEGRVVHVRGKKEPLTVHVVNVPAS